MCILQRLEKPAEPGANFHGNADTKDWFGGCCQEQRQQGRARTDQPEMAS